jgi:hypothetical protein
MPRESYQRRRGEAQQAGLRRPGDRVFREACVHLPGALALPALADLEVTRGRPVDAVNALDRRPRHLRARARGGRAHLLQRARKIQPTAFEPGFGSPACRASIGARDRAKRILLTWCRARGRQLRKLRAASSSLAHARGSPRWLVAALAR